MSGNDSTPREKLEAETRIIARSSKQIILELPDGERAITIVPLAYYNLEELITDISKLVAKFFSIAGKAAKLQTATESSPDEGVGTRSAGAEEQSEAPAAAATASVPQDIEDLFQPEIFIEVAHKFTGAIKRLIETGTDLSWEEAVKLDYILVIRLALEVLKYNIGPELRAFFVRDVPTILSGFTQEIPQPDTVTTG